MKFFTIDQLAALGKNCLHCNKKATWVSHKDSSKYCWVSHRESFAYCDEHFPYNKENVYLDPLEFIFNPK
jgi:hypothetical protein